MVSKNFKLKQWDIVLVYESNKTKQNLEFGNSATYTFSIIRNGKMIDFLPEGFMTKNSWNIRQLSRPPIGIIEIFTGLKINEVNLEQIEGEVTKYIYLVC